MKIIKLNAIPMLIIFFLAFGINLSAQNLPRDWHMLDYQKDHVLGISMERAYLELLEGKKSNPVIVAIICSGIDTLHKDLKSVLWQNPNEKLDGIDNDNNGYIDDIYGWNFLGNSKDPNKNVTKDTEESLRFYLKYRNQFADITSEDQIKKEKKELYKQWLNCKALVFAKTKEHDIINKINNNLELCDRFNKLFKEELNKEVYTLDFLNNYKAKNSSIGKALSVYKVWYEKFKEGTTNVQYIEFLNHKKDSLSRCLTIPDSLLVDYRGNVVGDNYNDINDRYYGNNNVMVGNYFAATYAAGIIGAVRNNDLGINGIADNVKIMVVRAVPGTGDEHDKDIALAIRYAVNNGAKIINMNFGKSFSPERKWVEDAIRYANSKDVLIVKAAGDNKANIDTVERFPTAKYIKDKKNAPNVITVGASGPGTEETGIVAPFSNYGKSTVDVFAPGTDIYSTVPGNKCEFMNGSHISSSIVTGLAAVLKSYFPHLSAKQIKQIIEESVTKIEEPVLKMRTVPVSMTDICRTGGVVNAYNAIKLAEEIVKE